MFAAIKFSTASSSFISWPIVPLPPLFCDLYSSGFTLFIYPPWVSTTTVSRSGIRSSIEKDLISPSITLVFRASPYFLFISENSFLMTSTIFPGSFKRDFNSRINFCFSSSSSSIFCLSSPAKVWSRISKIAAACFSDRLNFLTKFL